MSLHSQRSLPHETQLQLWLKHDEASWPSQTVANRLGYLQGSTGRQQWALGRRAAASDTMILTKTVIAACNALSSPHLAYPCAECFSFAHNTQQQTIWQNRLPGREPAPSHTMKQWCTIWQHKVC